MMSRKYLFQWFKPISESVKANYCVAAPLMDWHGKPPRGCGIGLTFAFLLKGLFNVLKVR